MKAPPEDGFVLVYDIETQNLISEVPGRFRDEKIQNLDISCVCAVALPLALCRNPTHRQRAYEERAEYTFWYGSTDAGSRLADLLELFDKAYLIVAYNQMGFDALVLRQYYGSQLQYENHMTKQFDVFLGVKGAMTCERWPKLDWLLKLNGLEAKEASGLQAVEWWKSGTPEDLEKLASYCLADVNLLSQLALLPTLNVGRARPLPNHCFGIASALAAREKSIFLENQLTEDELVERERE